MKYCSCCGSMMDDNMRFCPKCGNQYTEVKNQENDGQVRQASSQRPIQVKQKAVWWRILLIVICALVFLWGVGVISFNTDFIPHLNNEANYKEGVSYYEKANYTKARASFEKVDESYEDAKLYKILSRAHTSHYLTEQQVIELKNNLDFLDTKEVLLSNTDIAFPFLKGYWNSKDEIYYFEFYEQGNYLWTEYNLPHSNYNEDDSEGFYITNGVYGVKVSKNGDNDALEEMDLFRITILGADKIAVVCLKDNTRVVMTR